MRKPFLSYFRTMNDFFIQSIGFQRAKGIVGLINIVSRRYFNNFSKSINGFLAFWKTIYY